MGQTFLCANGKDNRLKDGLLLLNCEVLSAAECEVLVETGFEGYMICAFESRLHSNWVVHGTLSIRFQGSVLRCSFYLAPALQTFLQSVDRVGQLTNLIASIDIGRSGQVSLADTIRHLFEVGERFADAATD